MFYLEAIAVIFGFLYLIFIILKKPIAWFFGIISSLFYVYVFFSAGLFFQSSLQFFYILLGIYGWWSWTKQAQIKAHSWGLAKHLLLILIGLMISLIGGKFYITGQSMPFLDIFITVFCVLATYLTTRAILENWYYWIVLNILSMILYHYSKLYLTEILFLGNLVLSVVGLIHWKKIQT